MHIVVCIKQVPDSAQIRVHPVTDTIMRQGVPAIVNPYGLFALEEALRLKGRFGGRVTMLCMDPPQAGDALRKCLGFGATDAIPVTDRAFAGADTLATSCALAAAIRRIGTEQRVDLVFTGKQTIDGDTAQVGPGIAMWPGMNLLSYVSGIVELITVYETSCILCASLDIGRTFHAALNVLSAHLDLPRATIVMHADDEDGTLLQVQCSVGLTRQHKARGHWKSGEGVAGTVVPTGMPVVVPGVSQAPEFLDRTGAFRARGDEQTAFVVVPLKTDKNALGALAVQCELVELAQDAQLHAAVRDEHQRLQQETTRLHKALRREPRGRFALDNVIGESRQMQQVFAEVHQAAPSRATVLLRGESGTGKEAIARAVHYLTPRKDAPFIKVNCAALTETLLESELFGHEKGAFTGAVGDRKGRFDLAHGGTLFLDEIGDVSPAFQAQLLRVLQERVFERVGGTRAVKVDVRLICATNRDLEKMVQRGEYRADLYYRINVVSVVLPPLRERRADIAPRVAHLLDRHNQENRRSLKVSAEAMKVLSSCYWPGNVRELENCIERTATMVDGDTLQDLAFPCKQEPLPDADAALHGQGRCRGRGGAAAAAPAAGARRRRRHPHRPHAPAAGAAGRAGRQRPEGAARRRARAPDLGDGTVRLGAGQARAPAARDAAPAGLRVAEEPHRGQEVLARRATSAAPMHTSSHALPEARPASTSLA